MDSETNSPPPAPAPHDLEALRASFAAVERVRDPLEREAVRLHEAARLDLSAEQYAALFEIYKQKPLPRWLCEPKMRRLVDWFARLSVLALLDYVGKLAILLAIGSFFVECPDRIRQDHYANLGIIESTQGTLVSRARFDAIEKLNGDCFSLDGIHARGAQLRGLRLDRCYGFPGGALFGRWLPWHPEGARLFRADLSYADLRSARLARANLSFADLTGAWLEETDLTGARLRGANFQGAHLRRANLQGADLQDAHLEHADLTEAHLVRANLTGAHLDYASLIGAQLKDATVQYADLGGANAARAVLEGTDLFKTNLTHAHFNKAHFDARTSLDSAILTAAMLNGAVGLRADTIRAANDYRRAILNPEWEKRSAKEPELKVAMVVLDQGHFFQAAAQGAQAAAGKTKVAVRRVTAEPGAEAEAERKLVDKLIDEGFDGILIDPEEEHKSVDEARDAFNQGLVVVCYDQCIDDEHRRAYIAGDFESDQFQIGRETGKAVARWIAQQPARTTEVGILRYCETDGCFARVKGFRAALDDAGVKWAQAASSHRDGDKTSLVVATEMLGEHPEITVAWSANEGGTESLVTAVRARRRVGQSMAVKVWGTDISPEIARMLLDSDSILQAVTGQEPREMGNLGMSRLIAALQRKKYEASALRTHLHLFERGRPEAIESYLAHLPARGRG